MSAPAVIQPASEHSNAMLSAALELADRNVCVLPVIPRGKKCLLEGWPELATTDEAKIRAWWAQEPEYNVAIRTGLRSGVVALDVDVPGQTHPSAADGMAALAELEAKHGPLPTTWSGTTGGGGRRYFFERPRREVVRKWEPAGRGAGIELLADGQMVVVPPSVHPSGQRYTWDPGRAPEECLIAELPLWLLPPEPTPPPPHVEIVAQSPDDTDAWTEAALRGEVKKVANVSPGSRNNTLNSAAFSLGQIVASGHLARECAEAGLLDACFKNGLLAEDGEPAVRATIRSGLEAGAREPRGPKSNGNSAEGSALAPSVPAESKTLVEVLEIFQRWLYLPDPGGLLVLLGTAQANRMEGDPVWLMLLAPPGWAKTELLVPLLGVPGTHMTSTLTEPALLSGTPKRDKAADARGGLLKEIGERGLLVCKDFTSVLSMHRDARSAVLAALREIYDGAWTRRLGTDGGKVLAWQGRIGFVAGCTPGIDTHHAVMASMGERFMFYRLPQTDGEAETHAALFHAGGEASMRMELREAVAGMFRGVPADAGVEKLSREEQAELVKLAQFTTLCRSAVERDSYRREIELVPGAEAPTRLGKMLRRLFDGLIAIGVDRSQAWALMRRVALDSMPKLRREVIVKLATWPRASTEELVSTKKLAESMGYPTVTIRRTLEDLACYRLVERTPGRDAGDVHGSDLWGLADQWGKFARSVSEMSGSIYGG